MKSWKLLPFFAAIIALAGCASLEAPNTEALLSAAGFVVKTPSTPKQQAFYSALTPFELQHDTINGKPIYVYADKTQGVVYFGNAQAYQKYQQLSLKQQVAEDELNAAEMEEDAALDYSTWGPWTGFWD
ncbi:MAG: hypothetical protein ACREKL_00110 [Chthoniobacterales bacterium]